MAANNNSGAELPMNLNEEQKKQLAEWLSSPTTPEHFKRAAAANARMAQKINLLAQEMKKGTVSV